MKSERRAFTLIELVVVIAIIMVLVAILVASLRTPRGRAHQAVCMKNLREISAAAIDYANQHNSYPQGGQDEQGEQPEQVLWMDLIEDRIDKGSNIYRCPADTQQLPSYGINRFCFLPEAPLVDTDYSFWNGVKKYRVKRPSQTIIFADCASGEGYCGGGSSFPEPADPVEYVGYRHINSSFCAAFCDGHAEALTATTQEQWDASQ